MEDLTYEAKISHLKDTIKSYPDFPKEGIIFRDMFSLLKDPTCLKYVMDCMMVKIKELKWDQVDIVVGLESRGFILAPLLALNLNAGFVPVRKQGRLPGKCKQVSYSLEYRDADVLEIQENSILPGQRILVVDDLIATGGSLKATCKLIQELKADIVGSLVLLELEGLDGASNVGSPVKSLIGF